MLKTTKHLVIGLTVLLLTIVSGAFAYSKIEKKSLFEGVYYIFLIITTVGSSTDLLPSTTSGKILSIFVIMVGMGIVLYIVMLVAKIFIEGQIMLLVNAIGGGFRMIRKPKDHIIVCGYGKLGRYVCKNLEEEKQSYVVIEQDGTKVQDMIREKKLVIEGDALNVNTLQQANIKDAKALIAVLPTDADNIYLIMAAKELNPELVYAAKATDEMAVRRLHKIGAQIVVMPEVVGSRNMVKAVLDLQKSRK